LRVSIVPFVAVRGRDQPLSSEARRLAERWLSDRKSVAPDVVRSVLGVAARFGDDGFFQKLQTALTVTKEQQERDPILNALGLFTDPAVARAAMELVLKPEIDLREAGGLLFGPLTYRETRSLPFEFVKKNYDALTARL
jgi:hypothetical protein